MSFLGWCVACIQKIYLLPKKNKISTRNSISKQKKFPSICFFRLLVELKGFSQQINLRIPLEISFSCIPSTTFPHSIYHEKIDCPCQIVKHLSIFHQHKVILQQQNIEKEAFYQTSGRQANQIRDSTHHSFNGGAVEEVRAPGSSNWAALRWDLIRTGQL